MDINQSFIGNKWVDRCMKMIPEHPVTQSQYMYFLTLFVFLGLLGFALSSWYYAYIMFKLTTFFQAIFMTAISLLSLFGLKQTRAAYYNIKSIYAMGNDQQPTQLQVESVEEMQKGFKENAKV